MNYDYFIDGDYCLNQRQLTIHRDKVIRDSGKPFLVAYEDNLLQAMKDLSHSAFKVYVYMLLNRDGYRLQFSPSHIAKSTKISKDTAREAFRQMERMGYLEHIENHKYNFYEVPKVSLYLKEKEKRENDSVLGRELEEKYLRPYDDYNDNYDW